MEAALIQKLRWTYRKNLADHLSLVGGRFPAFVYAARPRLGPTEIPVFHFHSVSPELFGEQLEFLRRNEYTTLSCDQYHRIMTGAEPPPSGRAVLLTFDDGRATTWTVAYPMLAQHAMRAVCFLIPGYIEKRQEPRPRFDEATDAAARATAVGADDGPQPLCSWREIEQMHAGGVIDFQSHTMHHHLIPTGPQLVDFCRPQHLDPAVLANSRLPLLRIDGEERHDGRLPLGTPVYRSEPRMTDAPRYFDDAELRARCIDHVAARGGEAFFAEASWRRELGTRFTVWRRELGERGNYETPEEQRAAQREDLATARREIEARLPGHAVRHLCYPWFLGGRSAVAASREAGYLSNFWGSMPSHYRVQGRDPLFHVPRLEDLYLFRLPGENRWPLRRVLEAKWKSTLASRRHRSAG